MPRMVTEISKAKTPFRTAKSVPSEANGHKYQDCIFKSHTYVHHLFSNIHFSVGVGGQEGNNQSFYKNKLLTILGFFFTC